MQQRLGSAPGLLKSMGDGNPSPSDGPCARLPTRANKNKKKLHQISKARI